MTEQVVQAIWAEIDTWKQVPEHFHGAMKRKLQAAVLALASAPKANPVPWTERQTMTAIRATGSFGSVKLTSEYGPYDIDRPSFHCDRLVEAIIAQRDAQWLAALAPASPHKESQNG